MGLGSEFARASRHHDARFGAGVAQAADQIGGLVRGDTAGDADQHPFIRQGSHQAVAGFLDTTRIIYEHI